MHVRIKQLVDSLRSSLHPSVEGIHPEEIFRAVLKHERALAERNNHIFTVLTFFTEDNPIGENPARLLGRILADRLRATDLVGWLDARTIGVLLPDTSGKDASLVAGQICRKMTAHRIKLDYKCYLYPHEEYETPKQSSGAVPPGEGEETPSTRGGHDIFASQAGFLQLASTTVAETARLSREYSLTDLCVAPFPVWKRILDIGLCLFGLLFFGPLMLLIAMGIKGVAPGPVFFKQKRIGFRGKPFILYKFRSMKLNADTGVHKEHLVRLMTDNVQLTKLDKADARLIPCGRIFRASGLDELPQLINILRGDMSFIGPRPCLPYEYEQLCLWQKHRFDTHPGLTGLWQVSGKNRTTFTEMMRLDIAYGQRRTVINDFLILIKTLPAVLGQIRDCSSARR